jgi:hypothetical protein
MPKAECYHVIILIVLITPGVRQTGIGDADVDAGGLANRCTVMLRSSRVD